MFFSFVEAGSGEDMKIKGDFMDVAGEKGEGGIRKGNRRAKVIRVNYMH
jgi:hypothetical protein